MKNFEIGQHVMVNNRYPYPEFLRNKTGVIVSLHPDGVYVGVDFNIRGEGLWDLDILPHNTGRNISLRYLIPLKGRGLAESLIINYKEKLKWVTA